MICEPILHEMLTQPNKKYPNAMCGVYAATPTANQFSSTKSI